MPPDGQTQVMDTSTAGTARRAPDLHEAEPIPAAARAAIEELLQSADLFRYNAPKDAPVALLEAEFAELLGAKYALAVSSCSAALFLTMKALDLKPGARDLLDSLTVPAVLVTSSGRIGALRKLELTGILPAFAEIITLDEVTRPKPDPEPYLIAADRLGLAPARCLVFEDSETGAEAGHRAGCTVVQVKDVVQPTGRWAHHLADDLLSGARLAGLMR